MNRRKRARQMWVIVALEAASTLGEDVLFYHPVHVPPAARFSTTLTYTLIQEVFAEQLLPRTNTEWALHDGGIAMRFLQPLDLVSQCMAQMVGNRVFGLVFFSLPLLLVAPWLGVNPAPVGLLTGALFLVSIMCILPIGVAEVVHGDAIINAAVISGTLLLAERFDGLGPGVLHTSFFGLLQRCQSVQKACLQVERSLGDFPAVHGRR